MRVVKLIVLKLRAFRPSCLDELFVEWLDDIYMAIMAINVRTNTFITMLKSTSSKWNQSAARVIALTPLQSPRVCFFLSLMPVECILKWYVCFSSLINFFSKFVFVNYVAFNILKAFLLIVSIFVSTIILSWWFMH